MFNNEIHFFSSGHQQVEDTISWIIIITIMIWKHWNGWLKSTHFYFSSEKVKMFLIKSESYLKAIWNLRLCRRVINEQRSSHGAIWRMLLINHDFENLQITSCWCNYRGLHGSSLPTLTKIQWSMVSTIIWNDEQWSVLRPHASQQLEQLDCS